MSVPEIIISQLGGNKFIVMTGSKDFIGFDKTLKMSLAKNISKANRLSITLDGDDTYSMRFYRITHGHVNRRTGAWIDEKIVDIQRYSGVYCDQLQEAFTRVTGLYTHF